uniref:Putative ovule protein n=1 Tax=Solanum chacoense TaxID=4108 RepID=A0A0V0GW21_SOLCH
MILGYGMLGDLHTAIDMFEAMREDGVEHDSVSYIAVLSACSHGGLFDKGRNTLTTCLLVTLNHHRCTTLAWLIFLVVLGLWMRPLILSLVYHLNQIPMFGLRSLEHAVSMEMWT